MPTFYWLEDIGSIHDIIELRIAIEFTETHDTRFPTCLPVALSVMEATYILMNQGNLFMNQVNLMVNQAHIYIGESR